MNKHGLSPMQYLAVIVIAALMSACASIGRPEGGPRDLTPPVFTNSNPHPGALNVDRQRIEITFDENVQLEDAFNKVIISPVQKEAPQISANGRKVTVDIRDSLKSNTTYTIDFADAVKDLNEGNILDGFAIDFSTGDSIDSLRISGIVLEARTLEPAQGMLVGIYSNLSDTAITSLPMERIARTNQLGQFTVRNIKPGRYHIYALNDINRDYKWDRSEDIAFLDTVIEPYASPITVTDTLRGSDGTDSLSMRQGTAYFPNDVLLTWFNEGYASQYLKDYSRPERRRITLNMATKADSLPEVTVASGPRKGASFAEVAMLRSNPTLDSLEYWLRDTALIATDSLYLALKYQRTDTLDRLSWTTDTLKFFFKDPKKKDKKKKEEDADTLPPELNFLTFKSVTGNTQEIYMPLIFEASQPIESIDPSGIHLEMKQDTIWKPISGAKFIVDSINPLMRRRMPMVWEYGEKYRLSIDSAAVVGIYNEWNKPLSHEFTVKKPEDYSNLVFNITGTYGPAVVELLSKSDEPIAMATVTNGEARFNHLAPGTVYARLFIDRNGNGKWDTGALTDTVQPEDIYYYPKKLNLRKNWDIAQSWDINELPVDMQKPLDIKKNKPKLKKGEKQPGSTDEDEEEYDEFGDQYGGYGNSSNRNGNFNNGNFDLNSRRPAGNGSRMQRR